MEAKAFHNELKGEKPNLNAISTENIMYEQNFYIL